MHAFDARFRCMGFGAWVRSIVQAGPDGAIIGGAGSRAELFIFLSNCRVCIVPDRVSYKANRFRSKGDMTTVQALVTLQRRCHRMC